MDAQLTGIMTRTHAALSGAARTHKASERFHRQKALELRQCIAELDAACARLGIRLEIRPAGREEESEA